MAQRSPTIACEDVPLDEARHMSRRPRMDPELYHALKQKIGGVLDLLISLSTHDRTRCLRVRRGKRLVQR